MAPAWRAARSSGAARRVDARYARGETGKRFGHAIHCGFNRVTSAGVDRTRLVSASIWLSDPKYFAEFNAVWDAWVPAGHAPTRACVQALLMKPGCDVEVAVTALSA
ncbi:hypothetical protein GNZ12_27560 [Paraburkholderia sp. 1N]|uniref:RidA family protein n=1 Tax=Paraburkholderia solitsugae TaxID=2675748 RepID=A0ABX2BVU7_9BURK|nr:hypothetical protein [Paraburkholderia solitsugae]